MNDTDWNDQDTDRLEDVIDEAVWHFNVDCHSAVVSSVTVAVVEHLKKIGVIE